MTEGFLYVATGQKYIQEAINSAESLKRHAKSAKIALVTNKAFFSDIFDEIIVIDRESPIDWKTGLAFKVEGLLCSPFEKTFFLDTDTYFTDDVQELFRILDFFDMLICHASNDISKIKIEEKKLEGLSPYNTGVIVFKNSKKVESLFRHWKDLFTTNSAKYSSDQPAFMEALLYHDIKIYVLSYVYNFRFTSFITVPPLKVKLLHGRSSNYNRLDQIINKHPHNHRTWSPYWGMMFKNYRRHRRIKNLLISVFGRTQVYKIKDLVKRKP